MSFRLLGATPSALSALARRGGLHGPAASLGPGSDTVGQADQSERKAPLRAIRKTLSVLQSGSSETRRPDGGYDPGETRTPRRRRTANLMVAGPAPFATERALLGARVLPWGDRRMSGLPSSDVHSPIQQKRRDVTGSFTAAAFRPISVSTRDRPSLAHPGVWRAAARRVVGRNAGAVKPPGRARSGRRERGRTPRRPRCAQRPRPRPRP